MRIVFFGTPSLAVPSLAALAERHDVTAVVCQPDKPVGRSRKPAPPPVKVWAEEYGVPVHQPAKLNDGRFEAWLREQQPDLCAIAAYGRILKEPILNVPPHGFINMHPSLLPRHRGPSPIQTALLMGDTVTGVTIMRLILEMDAGDIILQEEYPIEPEDNTASLTEKLAPFGGQLLAKAVDLIEAGQATFTPQDHESATYTRMFAKEDGRIHWEESAPAIHNRVRACNPWPVAYCGFKGGACRIHRTALSQEPTTADPGVVVRVARDEIAAATGAGCISILELQLPGKRVMSAADFLRGHKVEPGDRFEDA